MAVAQFDAGMALPNTIGFDAKVILRRAADGERQPAGNPLRACLCAVEELNLDHLEDCTLHEDLIVYVQG